MWIGVYRAAEVKRGRAYAQKLQTGDVWWKCQVKEFGAPEPKEILAEENIAPED